MPAPRQFATCSFWEAIAGCSGKRSGIENSVGIESCYVAPKEVQRLSRHLNVQVKPSINEFLLKSIPIEYQATDRMPVTDRMPSQRMWLVGIYPLASTRWHLSDRSWQHYIVGLG
jgi:hypothetical protein